MLVCITSIVSTERGMSEALTKSYNELQTNCFTLYNIDLGEM